MSSSRVPPRTRIGPPAPRDGLRTSGKPQKPTPPDTAVPKAIDREPGSSGYTTRTCLGLPWVALRRDGSPGPITPTPPLDPPIGFGAVLAEPVAPEIAFSGIRLKTEIIDKAVRPEVSALRPTEIRRLLIIDDQDSFLTAITVELKQMPEVETVRINPTGPSLTAQISSQACNSRLVYVFNAASSIVQQIHDLIIFGGFQAVVLDHVPGLAPGPLVIEKLRASHYSGWIIAIADDRSAQLAMKRKGADLVALAEKARFVQGIPGLFYVPQPPSPDPRDDADLLLPVATPPQK